ncbi:hypothetical protein VCHA53O466_320052 [Vibrio chagasii]|nr:hypothetical protein VCHA53O466_320052 [Vibrio chagasii]
MSKLDNAVKGLQKILKVINGNSSNGYIMRGTSMDTDTLAIDQLEILLDLAPETITYIGSARNSAEKAMLCISTSTNGRVKNTFLAETDSIPTVRNHYGIYERYTTFIGNGSTEEEKSFFNTLNLIEINNIGMFGGLDGALSDVCLKLNYKL